MVRVAIPLCSSGSKDSPALEYNRSHINSQINNHISIAQSHISKPPQIALMDPSGDGILRYKYADIFLLWFPHPEALAQPLLLMPFVELSSTLLRVHLSNSTNTVFHYRGQVSASMSHSQGYLPCLFPMTR